MVVHDVNGDDLFVNNFRNREKLCARRIGCKAGVRSRVIPKDNSSMRRTRPMNRWNRHFPTRAGPVLGVDDGNSSQSRTGIGPQS